MMSNNQYLHKLRESQQIQFLMEYSDTPIKQIVGFIDLINSTEIVSSLSPEKMVKYYEIFLNFITNVIEGFNSKIIKNLGDSLLFNFSQDEKKDMSFFENCLDCCIALINKNSVINAKMKKEGLPSVNYRISADYGDVLLGKVSTSYVDDIIGEPVDRCQDLNHLGTSGQLIIGEKLYDKLSSLKKYKFLKHNKPTEIFNDGYQAYSVKIDNS
jgi:class 3 adenylate cyclase